MSKCYQDYTTDDHRRAMPAALHNSNPICAIVDIESCSGAESIMQEWVTEIRDQCLGAKVPFFFKQWAGVQKKRAGRTLEGRTWDEMPVNMNLVKA